MAEFVARFKSFVLRLMSADTIKASSAD